MKVVNHNAAYGVCLQAVGGTCGGAFGTAGQDDEGGGRASAVVARWQRVEGEWIEETGEVSIAEA